jgi:hypothetical protein
MKTSARRAAPAEQPGVRFGAYPIKANIVSELLLRTAGSGLDLPLSGRYAAPSKAVVAARWPSCDKAMAHEVANHAAGVEYLQYGGATLAFRLRIAPCIGEADLTRLGRIQPRRALEYHLVVRRRETLAKVSSEWDDLGFRRQRQKNQNREYHRQAAW